MKLSKLVFNIVKYSKYLSDTGFVYQSFIRGDYDADEDYALSINNAFEPLNEALHRLSDLNKIKFKSIEVDVPTSGNMLEIKDIYIDEEETIKLTDDIKQIVSIFRLVGSGYENIEFRELGNDKILLLSPFATSSNTIYIQYKQDIPTFDKSMIDYNQDTNEILDQEMKDYGVNETMCSYIIEYAQGKLQEMIAPELANLHLSKAEQYFNDLEEQQTMFAQARVERRYTI